MRVYSLLLNFLWWVFKLLKPDPYKNDHDILDSSNDSKLRLEQYQISTHPTTIIDEIIKVEGIPSFYWMCGDEFYAKLRKEYPFDVQTQ